MRTIRRSTDCHVRRTHGQHLQNWGAAPFGALLDVTEHRFPPGRVPTPSTDDESPGRPDPDTELLTYVYEGTLAQDDSTGGSGVLRSGEFQRLTVGRGVQHSERNASDVAWAHVFHVVLRPDQADLPHAHAEQRFSVADRRAGLRVVASADGRNGSLVLHLGALVMAAYLDEGRHVIHPLAPSRMAWLHVVSGEGAVEGEILCPGDGIGVRGEPAISFTARDASEILLIEVAADVADETHG